MTSATTPEQRRRGRSTRASQDDPFALIASFGLAMPDVTRATNWAGMPVLRAGGSFMAGLASHASAEPGTLVVRCEIETRELFLDEAPDTYYITDYYRPYPLVLVRLAHVDGAVLADLLSVSRMMALAKAGKPRRRAADGTRKATARSTAQRPAARTPRKR